MINKIKNIEITSPITVETFIDKDGATTPVNIIDYGSSHLLVDKKDLGSIDDIQEALLQLYWYKREYRYLLKLCFGEIKNKKRKVLEKKYRKDLDELNSWFDMAQQKYYERSVLNYDYENHV